MSATPPRVVIVDDAADVRVLVNARLRLSRRFTVVGEGASGLDAVALAERHRPDVMLLDVSMPRMDGLEALPKVLEVSPGTRVILFSGFDERGLAVQGCRLGASAFIEKSLPLNRLADELAAVLATTAVCREVQVGDAPAAGFSSDDAVLAEHVERFRDVFDTAALGMATMTLTGRIVRANAALARLLERPAAELVGARYADLPPGGSVDVCRAVDDLAQEAAEVAHVEHELAATSGTKRVAVTLATVRSSQGRPLYLSLQAHDVTRQRAAEEGLRQSEERFRLLVDAVQDYAIYMLDPHGLVVSWNPGAQRIKGYAAEEILGQHFRCFYPLEARRQRHPELELEVALRDGHHAEEGWRIRKDGGAFRASVVLTPIRDDAGRHVGFAKVTRDVSERHSTQESLRRSEERFRLLVDAVPDHALYVLDPQGRVASWNSGAERMTGYAAEEILGRHFRCFYPTAGREAGLPDRSLEVALRDGRYAEEGWRVRKDGEPFMAHVVLTPVSDAEGHHVGFAKVTRDLTERRTATRDRRAAPWPPAEPERDAPAASDLATAPARKPAAEPASELVARGAADQARFLAVTAHEMRGPVAALSGAAEVLAQHWQDLTEAERADLFDGMATSSHRLHRLLGDLLTAARLEAGSLEADLRTVSVADVLQEAARAARQGSPEVTIDVDAAADLSVLADRDHLAQAVDNLLSNALRHGEPPVRLSAAVEDATVAIRVSDAGSGVPVQMRPRLFERFASGDERGGRGLGLHIARELARLQGGDAWYEPALGQQPLPTFAVSVPRASP